jgi:putative transcriptional regulator
VFTRHETWFIINLSKPQNVVIRKGDRTLNKDLIAKKLFNLRGDKTREEVANDLDISVSALQMYENGQRVPKDEIKIKIAHHYGLTVQEIFFD